MATAHQLRQLGEAARRIDRPAAVRYYQQAVELLRAEDQPLLLAHAIRHLGDTHVENADPLAAEPCFAEALAIYRQHPEANPLDLANAIRSLALHRKTDAALWAEARDLYAQTGIAPGVEECNRWLGTC